MPLEIKQISDQNLWNNFIEVKKPKTFLQTWQWGEFNVHSGNKIFRLGIYCDSQLVGVGLIIKVVARRGSYFLCPHGPLIDWVDIAQVRLFIDYIKELAIKEKIDFIRICSLASNTEGNRNIFKNFGFRSAPIHVHPELSWMLDITPSEDGLLNNMRKNCRYAIKKAAKDGITVTHSNNANAIADFEKIYSETAVRQNFTPFSSSYIKKEFQEFAKNDKALLFLGSYHNEIISGAMIIFSNGSAFYHHGASTRKFKNIGTNTQLVQWEAIKEAKKRGCKYYNFWGIAPDNKPKHPFFNITHFKKGFGGFSEEYVHAQDLIIRHKYWLNYLIETLRRIKRGF